jgi:hypothetical protein
VFVLAGTATGAVVGGTHIPAVFGKKFTGTCVSRYASWRSIGHDSGRTCSWRSDVCCVLVDKGIVLVVDDGLMG